jgi:hypothetical protein
VTGLTWELGENLVCSQGSQAVEVLADPVLYSLSWRGHLRTISRSSSPIRELNDILGDDSLAAKD